MTFRTRRAFTLFPNTPIRSFSSHYPTTAMLYHAGRTPTGRFHDFYVLAILAVCQTAVGRLMRLHLCRWPFLLLFHAIMVRSPAALRRASAPPPFCLPPSLSITAIAVAAANLTPYHAASLRARCVWTTLTSAPFYVPSTPERGRPFGFARLTRPAARFNDPFECRTPGTACR